MDDADHVTHIVETYKRLGFTTAVDDFGAGHAGLGLLARFAPDFIKLDMELIRGLDANLPRRLIVENVVRMANQLGITTIAEGIETAEEFETLRALGVRYQQGYLFARPQLRGLPPIAFGDRKRAAA